MHVGYRIASLLALILAGLSYGASYWGWGLADDAAVRAQSVREGSLRGRRHMGGGVGYGK